VSAYFAAAMATIRLDSDERRKAIVAAAVPLFARRGFAGTTTKELAEAAGISEALLFRHFPSKKHLYGEILRLGCEGDPALERLAALEPSTATLVQMVHFMVRYFLLGVGVDRTEMDVRLRLVLHSFIEDGEYARELFERIFEQVHPLFAASIDAATIAGDLKPGPIAAANRFWFGQHIVAMAAFALLPGRASVPYEGNPKALVEEACWFILRGIGMRDAAIAGALVAVELCPFQTSSA
jgi:TetR/AcrR family transcriptional regulator, transcriptional repressor of aconitase